MQFFLGLRDFAIPVPDALLSSVVSVENARAEREVNKASPDPGVVADLKAELRSLANQL
jgi:hypothetical protein